MANVLLIVSARQPHGCCIRSRCTVRLARVLTSPCFDGDALTVMPSRFRLLQLVAMDDETKITVSSEAIKSSLFIVCLGSVAFFAPSVTAQSVSAAPPLTRNHQTQSTQAISIAQIPPQDLLPPSAPTPLPSPQVPLPLAPPIKLQPPSSPIIPEDLVPGASPATIVVKRFAIVGSTVFSAAELAKITAPFTNRPIAFVELLQVQAAITKLYTDQGYITSGAITPPQTIEGDVVTIQVVEGSLEAIKVTGTRRLNPNYVRSRLAIATQKPLNSRRLLEALQLLQVNPLIQTITAELSTGTRPGTNLLEIRVTEAKTFGVQVALDNDRSPAVGSLRRSARISEANLLGQGDGLQIGYANTDGSNVIDFNYTLPLNPRNGTLSFAFNTGFNRIVEAPFEPLDLKATSRSFNVTFRQPIIETPSRLVALGVTASREESETSILGVPLQLSQGSDDNGHTRISALRFFQEWTERKAQSVFAIRSEFSVGLNVLNATINSTPPDSRFLSWRGQLQWVRLLAPDTLLVVRSNAQLANRSLVSLEQVGLGGQDSVRGYRQDLLLADNGLLASAELRFPIARFRQKQGIIQMVPFVDFGAVWNSSGRVNTVPNTLTAIGLGLRWQQGDRFTFRFDWGIPLVSVHSSKNTWQENGLYFSVVYNLF